MPLIPSATLVGKVFLSFMTSTSCGGGGGEGQLAIDADAIGEASDLSSHVLADEVRVVQAGVAEDVVGECHTRLRSGVTECCG